MSAHCNLGSKLPGHLLQKWCAVLVALSHYSMWLDMHRHCGFQIRHVESDGYICQHEPRPCCRQLTALRVCQALGRDGDEDIAALAGALPQLRALELKDSAKLATDTGLRCIAPYVPQQCRMPDVLCVS
jgi:hypothetical protein